MMVFTGVLGWPGTLCRVHAALLLPSNCHQSSLPPCLRFPSLPSSAGAPVANAVWQRYLRRCEGNKLCKCGMGGNPRTPVLLKMWNGRGAKNPDVTQEGAQASWEGAQGPKCAQCVHSVNGKERRIGRQVNGKARVPGWPPVPHLAQHWGPWVPSQGPWATPHAALGILGSSHFASSAALGSFGLLGSLGPLSCSTGILGSPPIPHLAQFITFRPPQIPLPNSVCHRCTCGGREGGRENGGKGGTEKHVTMWNGQGRGCAAREGTQGPKGSPEGARGGPRECISYGVAGRYAASSATPSCTPGGL